MVISINVIFLFASTLYSKVELRLIIAIALIQGIGLTFMDIISSVDAAKSRIGFCASAVRNAVA
jgi:hypothetical protein